MTIFHRIRLDGRKKREKKVMKADDCAQEDRTVLAKKFSRSRDAFQPMRTRENLKSVS